MTSMTNYMYVRSFRDLISKKITTKTFLYKIQSKMKAKDSLLYVTFNFNHLCEYLTNMQCVFVFLDSLISINDLEECINHGFTSSTSHHIILSYHKGHLTKIEEKHRWILGRSSHVKTHSSAFVNGSIIVSLAQVPKIGLRSDHHLRSRFPH